MAIPDGYYVVNRNTQMGGVYRSQSGATAAADAVEEETGYITAVHLIKNDRVARSWFWQESFGGFAPTEKEHQKRLSEMTPSSLGITGGSGEKSVPQAPQYGEDADLKYAGKKPTQKELKTRIEQLQNEIRSDNDPELKEILEMTKKQLAQLTRKSSAKKILVASLRHKEADLDILDSQILSLPDASPAFDNLAQKREEMEKSILQMQEGVALVDAWDAFKSEGGWSSEVKKKLDSIDTEIVNTADEEAGLDEGFNDVPPAPSSYFPAEEDNSIDEPLPAIDQEAPISDDDDYTDISTPMDSETEIPDIDTPPAPVVAASKSSSSNKTNYKNPNKKEANASTSSPTRKGKDTMIKTPSSLKERIASMRLKRAAGISKEAQTRVASAWTIAKTMLPTAPASAQEAFAKTLLANDTTTLKATLRQTARNAAFQKVCESLAAIHKCELNDLMEDPSILSKAKKEVASEIKGEAKNAQQKKADDREEAGEQPAEYPEPKRKEPSEIDASKAAERPADTVNKSEGDKTAAKTKKACACGGSGCGKCKAAATKVAEGEEDIAPTEDIPNDESFAEDEVTPEDAPYDDDEPSEEGDLVADEKTQELQETVSDLQSDIDTLQELVSDEGEEELDLSSIFDGDNLEEKVSALANEGESHVAAEDEDEDGDYFGPSKSAEMEGELESDHDNHIASMFDMTGSDSDPLASLIASAHKYAEDDKVVKPGTLADTFESQEADHDDRDSDTDHEDNVLFSGLKSIKLDEYGGERTEADSTNDLELPKGNKEASKKKVVARLKVTPPSRNVVVNFGEMLMNDDNM